MAPGENEFDTPALDLLAVIAELLEIPFPQKPTLSWLTAA